RSPTGEWSPLETVVTMAVEATRPQCLVDESNGRIYVFYSAHGGGIYYKSRALAAGGFPGGVGTPPTLPKGINTPTPPKQTVDAGTGAVILASTPASAWYWHGIVALGPVDPLAGSCSGE